MYGKGNERRLTGRHETANVSFHQHQLKQYSFDLFRLINSMLVLPIEVPQFEFPVKSVKRNVAIWKIVVPHQTAIRMLSLTSLSEQYVSTKKILKKINHYQAKNQSPNEIEQLYSHKHIIHLYRTYT